MSHDRDESIAKSARIDEIARLKAASASWSSDDLRKRIRTLARVAADATASGDDQALAELHGFAISASPRLGDGDSEFRRGVFETLAALAAEAKRESESREVLAKVAVGSLPHRMLALIEGHEAFPSAEVGSRLGEGATTVSRAGRILADRGLVKKVGTKPTTWTITHRGQRVLDAVGRVIPAEESPRDVDPAELAATILKSLERFSVPLRRYAISTEAVPTMPTMPIEPVVPLPSVAAPDPFPFDPVELSAFHVDFQRLIAPFAAPGFKSLFDIDLPDRAHLD